MKNLKSIIKYILIFIGLIAILLGTFVATVKFIPREKIENNIKESLPYLESNTELIEVKPTREYSYLHVYADEILLNIMYCMDSNQPLKSVMEAKYYSDNAVLEDLPSLEKALENGGEGNQEYIRYWHGSTIIIRPLLIFFNINEIYHIFAIIMIILIATLFIILIKKKQYILIIATIIGYIMIAINYVPFCLEYVWTFLIMLVVSIIGILTKKHNMLFFITGIITCFLDFLSTEIITVFVPLIYIYTIKYKNGEIKNFKEGIKLIAKYTILWGLGYCLMWGAKWLLASMILNMNALDFVISKAQKRINGGIRDFSKNYILLNGILRNVKALYPFYLIYEKTTIVCIILGIVIPTVLMIKKDKKSLLNFFIFILIAITPYIRYLILSNHSFLHYMFTFRDQLITIMALIVGITLSIDKEKLKKEVNFKKDKTKK